MTGLHNPRHTSENPDPEQKSMSYQVKNKKKVETSFEKYILGNAVGKLG